jgi:hypothetical protein
MICDPVLRIVLDPVSGFARLPNVSCGILILIFYTLRLPELLFVIADPGSVIPDPGSVIPDPG